MLQRMIANPIVAVLIMFGLAGAVVMWVVSNDSAYVSVQFVPDVNDAVIKVLMPILFVGLLVERSLEVFVSNARKHGRQPLERRLLKAREKLAQLASRSDVLQAQLDGPGAGDLTASQRDVILARLSSVADHVPEAQRELRDAEAEIEEFKGETRKIAYVVGTLIGLIIGLAGVRALSPLIQSQFPEAAWFQEFAFNSIDVAMTAALLAGGAAGVHQVISVFGDYTQKVRKGAQT
jgi:hypothetical protein